VASLSVAPAEAIAVVTYLAIFFPWLYATKTTPLGSVTVLTAPGVIIAFALLTVFFLINYYGVKIMGSTNTSLTYIKFVIPSYNTAPPGPRAAPKELQHPVIYALRHGPDHHVDINHRHSVLIPRIQAGP
jgi:hypothetical protein